MSVFKVGSNKSSQNNFPSVRPTLDLDFANSKTLDPRITFTRASGGSYVGADGLIKYAGVNEARFDHDPYTGESLGFLVEESRTNIRTYSILFDSGVSGALYGNWNYATTPSNTAAIAPDGTLTANRFRPITPTGTLMQRFSATAGLTYTISMYLKLDPESPSNANVFYFGFYVAWSNDGSTLTSHAPSPSIGDQLTNEWKRFSFSYTLPAGAISMEMGPSNRSYGGVDPNYSVLAWGWQIEQGSFPTSYIPTVASSRTRAAESASITGKNFSSWYNPIESSAFVDVIMKNSNGATGFPAYAFKGSSNYYYGFSRDSVNPYHNVTTSNVNSYLYGTLSSNGNYKACMTWKQNDINSYINSVQNYNTNSVTLFTPDILYLGAVTNTSNILNGTIRKFTYYPKRLTDAQLQVLTK